MLIHNMFANIVSIKNYGHNELISNHHLIMFNYLYFYCCYPTRWYAIDDQSILRVLLIME